MNNKQLKADMMLLMVTLCWGVSYYLMDVSLGDLGVFTLNSYRFIGAFIVAGILAFKKLKNVSRETIKYSLVVGITLVVVYIGASFGVKNTSLSNSGFLCALTVIFTPIFELLFLKKKPKRKLVFAVSLSLVGIMLLTLKSDFSINSAHIKGDLLCIMCAVAYAMDLVLTEKAVSNEKVDAFQLGVFQLLVTGVCMSVLAIAFEQPHLPSEPKIWASVGFLTVFCTGAAFIVQAVAQQYTSASHVGVIFTLEPVFAGMVAYFVAKEVLTLNAYIGAILMIAALFVTEIDFKKFKRTKEKGEEPENYQEDQQMAE